MLAERAKSKGRAVSPKPVFDPTDTAPAKAAKKAPPPKKVIAKKAPAKKAPAKKAPAKKAAPPPKAPAPKGVNVKTALKDMVKVLNALIENM